MTRKVLRVLGLLLLLFVSLTLKQIKYANDQQQWTIELDRPLKDSFRASGFKAHNLNVTHGGFASLYVFKKAGCADYQVLSLRNTEDGIAAAFRHRVMLSSNDEPIILLDGKIYKTLPLLQLYRSTFQNELGRLTGAPIQAGSFLMHPDPRDARANCQLDLTPLPAS